MDFNLRRQVEPELLDGLAAEDPQALRSRKDLRWIHRAMATLVIMQRALNRGTAGFVPRTLLELGAGDGSLMLRMARKQTDCWPAMEVTLLDRLNLVEPQTLEEIHKLGWTPRVVTLDIFHWLEGYNNSRTDIVIANLFMHHFSSKELARLLAGIAARSQVFLCCEPRRSILSLVGAHCIGLLGAGPVTRHDAVSSVHAGFRAQELSELWPNPQNWVLHEYSAGLFTHCFLAIWKGA
ncbi:class I SAM-dependent methyltransferase [Ferrovum myxofaciens]|uniref:Methyltransferase domain-containing protein n=1 Tax=Ferrovum myxofaciens TaxID=416213 RepID=A0A149VVA8_9PROT|nr:hypothetical protein [Ferrovum myxofaciens]KXW57153.1 hypothetical protein FEMY_23280 [Ferrovum myxofaciens]MBU6993700.1 hypothetical protein [Ferrovum myxofaciens]